MQYSSKEEIEFLKSKLTTGKEYLFSDMLQEEKNFLVEWEKGTLCDIKRHPNSANCFVKGSQFFWYIKEIN